MPDNRFLERLTAHFAERRDTRFVRMVSRSEPIELSWGDLEGDCRRFAGAYRQAGLREGDLVLIFLRHEQALYGSFLGAMFAGAVPSFMPCLTSRQNPALYWSSHRTLVEKIKPAAIVASGETVAEMQANGLDLDGVALIDTAEVAQMPEADFGDWAGEDSVALLQHSSGTTGLKKGVKLSFAAIAEQIESYAKSLEASERDVIASWLPLYHDMGLLACFLTPVYLGLPSIQIDPFVWVGQPDILLREIDAHDATLCWLPNFAFDHLAKVSGRKASEFGLSSMRAFVDCSEPCRPQTFDRFLEAFALSGATPDMLHCCYAMAETVFAVSQTPLGRPAARITVDPTTLQPGAIPELADGGVELVETGTPLSGVEIRTADSERNPGDPAKVGEIAIAAPFLFTGYNCDEERTSMALSGGLYFTNDIGFMHDGSLYVLGRNDDLVIINGRNIFAHELEAELQDIAGIRPGRSLAFAETDLALGTDHLVILCERDEAAVREDREIITAINERIFSIFEIRPRIVRINEPGSLVKTTSGKISREKNREIYQQEKRHGVAR